ncbi:MAG: mevalonate kinase [Nitrososphaeria archaeon]|nr:mevalonate kinase [Nitrososphaeria archaeon]NIN52090.1 mevalonate kinase [Nitrososphaeria archaeon]NIQ32552.1 mevalonate kinase [Nitrososphaeria archaeon]
MFVDASAPGKVILAGEHFVVHGGKALALAIDRYVDVRVSSSKHPLEVYHSERGEVDYLDQRGRWILSSEFRNLTPIETSVKKTFEYLGKRANLKLDISSNIPVSAGLGSSASLSAAIVKGVSHRLGYELSRDELIKVASESEKVVHGDPSGVDLATVISGGLVLFDGSTRRILKNVKDVDFPLVVGNSLDRRSTGDLVGNVGVLSSKYKDIFSLFVHLSDHVVEQGLEATLRGDLETLGRMFNISHGLLHSIGVSTAKLEAMIFKSLSHGALGAKVTGAGGGGCMIVLTGSEENRDMVGALKSLGSEPFIVRPDNYGVKSILKAK